ncbi:MAG TPA: DUF2855 family protein [Myxococcota bacterium]|jgi:hypothetical protein
MSDAVDFQVRRDDFRSTRFTASDVSSLAPANGQALLRVDHFAFTANNVTYAAAGDLLNYWSFFPAEPGWGRIPVWGFADVVASRCAGVAEGARFYGYYPMSTHLVVEPVDASAAGFRDGAAHRSAMAAAYNQYRNTTADPGLGAGGEDAQMILQPLFVTAFLIDDFLAESGFFGARAVVLSSASSKTAIGLAFQLSQRAGVEVIGLTSPRNTAFVEGLGCYHRVLPYGELTALDTSQPAIFVDMAGDGEVQGAVHRHYGANLVHSCSVGMTHWEHGKKESDLPGAKPSFFFAPTRLRQRFKDWGPAGYQERIGRAFGAFALLTDRSLRVVRGHRADVERVYRDTLEGRTAPDEGHVLSLHER